MQTATTDAPASRPAPLDSVLTEERKRNLLDGRAAGRNWGKSAQKWLLRNLAEFVHRNGGAWEQIQDRIADGSATRPGSGLVSIITGVREVCLGSDTIVEFWEAVLGPDSLQRICDRTFANGFVDAACEVWWESVRERETQAAQAAD